MEAVLHVFIQQLSIKVLALSYFLIQLNQSLQRKKKLKNLGILPMNFRILETIYHWAGASRKVYATAKIIWSFVLKTQPNISSISRAYLPFFA